MLPKRSIMYLPNEILLLVFRYLEKRDLKCSRHISHEWSLCAAKFLFDKVFVSPRKVDLEVFDAVTQHPIISTYVRKLEYDATQFRPDLSVEEYFHRVYTKHMPWAELHQQKYDSPDPQINEFIDMLVYPMEFSGPKYERIRNKCIEFDFITEGHRKWKEFGTYQRDSLRNGDFPQKLHNGLKKLPILDSVTIRDVWRSSFAKQADFSMLRTTLDRGSPLFRSWNPFHASPEGWVWEPISTADKGSDGSAEFWFLTSVLSLTRKKVRSFKVDRGGLPPPAFDTDIGKTRMLLGHALNAYHALEVLSLSLARYGEENTTQLFPHIDGFQALLKAMPRLKRLKLNLPDDDNEIPITLYTYDQIFPADGEWTAMEDFDIDSLSFRTKDLQYLLSTRMPNLRRLTISMVKLLDGTWEGFFEWARVSLHLSSLSVNPEAPPLQRDGSVFGEEEHISLEWSYLEYEIKFLRRIDEYVIHGGRHPSLPKAQPDSASLEYLLSLPS